MIIELIELIVDGGCVVAGVECFVIGVGCVEVGVECVVIGVECVGIVVESVLSNVEYVVVGVVLAQVRYPQSRNLWYHRPQHRLLALA